MIDISKVSNSDRILALSLPQNSSCFPHRSWTMSGETLMKGREDLKYTHEYFINGTNFFYRSLKLKQSL